VEIYCVYLDLAQWQWTCSPLCIFLCLHECQTIISLSLSLATYEQASSSRRSSKQATQHNTDFIIPLWSTVQLFCWLENIKMKLNCFCCYDYLLLMIRHGQRNRDEDELSLSLSLYVRWWGEVNNDDCSFFVFIGNLSLALCCCCCCVPIMMRFICHCMWGMSRRNSSSMTHLNSPLQIIN
jgi:hypothetical protein